MEKNLSSVLKRFPHLGVEIFNNLDNKNLTKCKEVSRYQRKFLEEKKLLWTRMIEKYIVNHQRRLDVFKEDWNLMMKKVPVKIVKELALAVEQFYTLRQTQHGAQLSFYFQHSPHHIAAESGSLSLYKFIAQKTKVLNPARKDGFTAFHFAAQEGHLDLCKYFVDNLDGDKNPPCNPGCGRRTPLHEAAFQGDLEVFKYIANQANNKNPVDEDGKTPLHNAVTHRHIQIVKCIMDLIDEEKKSDPLTFFLSMNKNVKNNLGLTPIHIAVQRRNYEICKVLIDHGADPNPTSDNGTSALAMAGTNQEIRDLILKNL